MATYWVALANIYSVCQHLWFLGCITQTLPNAVCSPSWTCWSGRLWMVMQSLFLLQGSRSGRKACLEDTMSTLQTHPLGAGYSHAFACYIKSVYRVLYWNTEISCAVLSLLVPFFFASRYFVSFFFVIMGPKRGWGSTSSLNFILLKKNKQTKN